MTKLIPILGLVTAIVMPVSAHAETASDFLRSLEGNYSGRGNATIVGDSKSRVACKINNVFSDGEDKLVVSGECASTKGKGKINGGIVAKNNTVRGSFVAPRKGMEVTQSSGSFNGSKMQLSTSMVDQEAGKLVKVRQIISKTGSGIKAEFFVFDNKTKQYEASGSIDLKKL
ncbi:MAG: hypothetical protein WBC71_05620 [Salaquimonas sp.]